MVQDADWFSPDASERVVWHGKPRVRRIIPRVVWSVVWSVVAVAGGWALFAFDIAGNSVGTLAVWGVVALVVLYEFAQVAFAYLRVRATDYVLTDRNVYKKTGVFSETVTRVGIGRIQNTTLRKDLTGNLFDYGTIVLSTAGSGGSTLAITDLDDPEQFQDALGPLVEASGGLGDGYGGRDDEEELLDAETVEAMLPEARRLREAAERLEARFDS